MMKILLALLLCFTFTVVASVPKISPELFKSVQGPPEEFGLHQLPDPGAAAQTSDSFLFPVNFEQQADGTWKFETTFPVDSIEELSLSVISRVQDVEAFIAKAGQDYMKIDNVKNTQRVDGWFGLNEYDSAPATTYTITNPQTGTYSLTLTTKSKPADNYKTYVLLNNKSPLRIFSHLNGNYQQLMVNQEISMSTRAYDQNAFNAKLNDMGLTSRLGNGPAFAVFPDPVNGIVLSADMDIKMPDGEEKVITMHDDGLHGDFGANDGVFAGSFMASQEGAYVTQVVMRGVTPNGDTFIRATQHVFNVVENDGLVLQDSASAVINPQDEMMKINLKVAYDAAAQSKVVGQKYRVYAEVYGTSVSSNEEKAVAFTGGMAIAEQAEGNFVNLKVELSMKWLSRAQVSLPLKLRNVYLQESFTNVPVCVSSSDVNVNVDIQQPGNDILSTVLSLNADVKNAIYRQQIIELTTNTFAFNENGAFTETMLFGKRPLKLQRFNNGTNANGKLILVHGYCAGDVPFETSHFTDYLVFEDLKQSRTTDEFALLINKFAENAGPFSIVAHSQGGLAALHLKTFYWSGQDGSVNDNDHRLLQSVGSPYSGCTLAGTLAGIGDAIGVGCGKNVDLTTDGAQLWLAGISKSARQYVYFYTTQYADWSWCNLAANLVLQYPNDGTAELDYSVLDGGNYINHVKKQCHSVNMKYPPQCKDATRNAEINTKASRGL